MTLVNFIQLFREPAATQPHTLTGCRPMPEDGAGDGGPSSLPTWDDDSSPPDATQMQLDALTAAEQDIHERLRDGQAREAAAAGARPPTLLLADARRKRDLARRDVQRVQARLSQILKDRQASTKRLDKLQKAASQRVVNPEQLTLPSVALRSGGDDAIAEEIRTLMRENKELERKIGKNDGARIHLEKLQNEKRDTMRQVKELKEELNMVERQLEIKRVEENELKALAKPSPVREAFQKEVKSLQNEISKSSSAKTTAEREASKLSKRLLHVRTVLGPFLKAEGLKPQQPLPADDEMAGRLADYILGLADKVRNLEGTLAQREERTAALESSAEAAASELKKLVAKRSQATVQASRKTVAIGMLTADSPIAAAAVTAAAAAKGGAGGAADEPSAIGAAGVLEGAEGAAPSRRRTARKPKKSVRPEVAAAAADVVVEAGATGGAVGAAAADLAVGVADG